jgi:hypothetical protein
MIVAPVQGVDAVARHYLARHQQRCYYSQQRWRHAQLVGLLWLELVEQPQTKTQEVAAKLAKCPQLKI